jgi:DNA-binding MarR family transcriptional regulator
MRTVSRQDRLNPPKIDDVPPETSVDADQLQLEIRFDLDKIAAAEEERLRNSARRRPTRRQLTQLASKLYEARRGRDRLFDDKLFGEPAWDMLLALYCLPARGIVLSVTSLGYAANVPPSTGTRWQKLLLKRRLIKRGPHITDGRQQLVGLTTKGRMLMERYLIRLFYCQTAEVPELDR